MPDQSDQPSDASPQGAAAPTAGGIAAPPQLSLPKGGGAIRGIGEKFTANPVTGTGSLTVPIATSPAVQGSVPSSPCLMIPLPETDRSDWAGAWRFHRSRAGLTRGCRDIRMPTSRTSSSYRALRIWFPCWLRTVKGSGPGRLFRRAMATSLRGTAHASKVYSPESSAGHARATGIPTGVPSPRRTSPPFTARLLRVASPILRIHQGLLLVDLSEPGRQGLCDRLFLCCGRFGQRRSLSGKRTQQVGFEPLRQWSRKCATLLDLESARAVARDTGWKEFVDTAVRRRPQPASHH
jgi:hypothetical protein